MRAAFSLPDIPFKRKCSKNAKSLCVCAELSRSLSEGGSLSSGRKEIHHHIPIHLYETPGRRDAHTNRRSL